MTEGPVIIVGGRLNGLTVAVLLADLVFGRSSAAHDQGSSESSLAGESPVRATKSAVRSGPAGPT